LARSIKNKTIENLTEQEVWDVIEFARNMQGGFYGSNILNPDLVNQRLKDVSLNPLFPTSDGLEKALQDPKNSEIALQGYSESFELTSQPYKRLLSYLANMLAFDLTYTCLNAEESDYKSPQYKKDLKVIENFIDSFDYKKEFLLATKQMLRNELFVCSPRFDGKRVVLQELPASPQYTKITGRWDYGFLISMSFYWFLLPGVDPNMYSPFFKRKFNDLFSGIDGKAIQQYIPSISPYDRGDSSWVYWQDLPVTESWAFKLDSSLATRIPYFSPLMNDLQIQGIMRNLQKNINMAAASKILTGEVPMLNEAKASVKDMIAINPELLGKFMGLVKSALGDSIRIASAPLKNMTPISFDAQTDIYDSYLKTAMATSGINSNLIFSSNIKPNAVETRLSLETDEQLMYMALYSQFNDFMNYHANRFTKKFKWDFQFEGTNFFTNRQDRYDKAIALAQQGIVLPQKIAASVGMKPHHLYKQLMEAKASGFGDLLVPLLPPNYAIGANGEGDSSKSTIGEKGRPKMKDSEVSDSGSGSRETRGN